MTRIIIDFFFLTNLLAGLAVADDWKPNFSETCTDISWDQALLTATCQLSGGTQTSDLELASCIGVDPNTGYLRGQDNGNFSWPASTCGCGSDTGEMKGYTLNCSCTTSSSRGQAFASTFDLNQVVGNTAGVLYCYSTLGTTIPDHD